MTMMMLVMIMGMLPVIANAFWYVNVVFRNRCRYRWVRLVKL